MHACLYAKDGVVERLHDLKHNEPEKYETLAYVLSDWDPFIDDPKRAYSVNHPCLRPVGHNMNYAGERDDLGHMNTEYFGAALGRLDSLWSPRGS